MEVEQKRKYGARMPIHAPGCNTFLRFPMRQVSYRGSQLDVLRRLWYQCYFGKDFEGATMVSHLNYYYVLLLWITITMYNYRYIAQVLYITITILTSQLPINHSFLL